MMGDSAAMFVDALTYLFNLVAERKKGSFDETWQDMQHQQDMDPERALRLRERAKRKMTLMLELVPPLISVTTLILVTIFVLRKAIRVLILDVHRDISKQGDPNINLMLFFSTLNLGLDLMNVFCFAKAKHLMGYDTLEGHKTHPEQSTGQGVARVSLAQRKPKHYEYVEVTDLGFDDEVDEDATATVEENGSCLLNGSDHRMLLDSEHSVVSDSSSHKHANGRALPSTERKHGESTDACQDEQEGANLNMCSAYTHVFADTLRSIAVIIASVIAEFVDIVTPEEADATAAVVVSTLILLSLIPLFHGLVQTFSELKSIRAEESYDVMFPEQANRTNDLV